MGFAFPKPGNVVKWLLIINIVVFFLQALFDSPRAGSPMTDWFGAVATRWYELWRYVTFQFLHAGVWHLALNMLGLYFLGTPLEQRFGSRWFLKFYLACGVVAGIAFVLMGMIFTEGNWRPIVGASGGVYGTIVAAAVYFPHFRLIFLFFPVPIRLAAVIIFSIMGFTIISGIGGNRDSQFWSDVAHFGGAATAGVWILLKGKVNLPDVGQKVRQGAWEKKIADRRRQQKEVDRILEKIHQEGINSLTGHEKRLLKKATEQQREEDKRVSRL
jgi:membrane associated rhomboid family serine protease